MDYKALQQYVFSRRIFDSELHGIVHWRKVEFNGMLLAKITGADMEVVRLFALFHDSKRADDGFFSKKTCEELKSNVYLHRDIDVIRATRMRRNRRYQCHIFYILDFSK